MDFPSTPLDSARSHKNSTSKSQPGEVKPERSSSIKDKDKIVHSNTAGSIGSAGDTLRHSNAGNPPIKKANEANMISDKVGAFI